MSAYTPSNDVMSIVLGEMHRKTKAEAHFDDPAQWARDVLGAELWSKQEEMLASVVKNKRTAVKSCHSTGKTFTMGILACWWVCTRGFQSLVVTTAPTFSQVSAGAWNEIRKQWGVHTLPGDVTAGDVWNLVEKRSDGKERREMVGFGRTPSVSNQSAFQGLHRDNGVLFLMDEAVGIPASVFTAAQVNTTSPHDRIFAIANPDDVQTEFGRIFEADDPTWNKISISAYDTPAFTGEVVSKELLSHLPQPDWIKDMKIQWGEDSSRFKAKILAEFPTQSDFMFYTQHDIDTSIAAGEDAELTDNTVRPVFGVDLASMGEDFTAVYGNWNGRVRLVEKWNKMNLMDSKDKIRKLALEHGATEVRIDSIGIGEGVFDAFANEIRDFERDGKTYEFKVMRMKGSEKSPDNFLWANSRAYHHDNLRKGMAAGKYIIDPEDKQLIAELLSQRFETNAKGAIQMESKRVMRGRGAKSPDCLDAVTYAVADLEYLNGPQPGDTVRVSANDYAEEFEEYVDPVFNALPW